MVKYFARHQGRQQVIIAPFQYFDVLKAFALQVKENDCTAYSGRAKYSDQFISGDIINS